MIMKTIYLYGIIGEEGCDAKHVIQQLDGMEPGEEIELRINTPGGDVFDGFSILSILEKFNYTAIVDGLAASMGSVIFANAKRRVMNVNSMLMVHRAKGGNHGNADEMKARADMLNKIDGRAFEIYSRNWKKTPEELRASIATTTFFSAQECLDNGLCDEIREVKPEREIEISADSELGVLLFAKSHVISGVKSINKPEMKAMKQLAVLLALTEAASEDAVLSAVKDLKARSESNASTVTDLRADLTKATATISELTNELTQAKVSVAKATKETERAAILAEAKVVLGGELLAKLDSRIDRFLAAVEADKADLRIDAINYAKLNGVPSDPVTTGQDGVQNRTTSNETASVQLVEKYAKENNVSFAVAMKKLADEGKVKV